MTTSRYGGHVGTLKVLWRQIILSVLILLLLSFLPFFFLVLVLFFYLRVLSFYVIVILHIYSALASAFILSRLDYCNSLLAGLPNDKLQNLQRIQNSAARLVLGRSKYDHATPMLRELHWLPIKARIEYKLALTCFKSKSGNYPSYISDLLVPYTPTRSLRSSSSNNFSIPRIHLKGFGERAFTFSGPSVWNALPQEHFRPF